MTDNRSHQILKGWNEVWATNRVASQSGSNKNKWDEEMMGELTDYDPEVVATDIISEGEDQHNIYVSFWCLASRSIEINGIIDFQFCLLFIS